MSGRFLVLALALMAMFGSALAQVATTKKVVVNPDGSYSVIEYPVGKEVVVNLSPTGTVTGKGVVHVTRSADGTHLIFNMSGVPGDVTNYYAYAVDPSGAATLLGPLTFTNGVATADFTTPLNQFMVVLSPTEGITTIDPSTAVIFRSEVPAGYTVIPRRVVGDTKAAAVPSGNPSAYNVPVLNVPSFGEKTRELKIKFGGDLQGLEGKAYLTYKKGATKVKMHFDDMNKVPKGQRFVLWAAAPDGTYTRLGQVWNSGKKDEAEINTTTALNDFGLFMTVESADVTVPTSTIYSTFTVTPLP
ncbi:MAG TPA: hypothetical protein VEV84_08125 [Pyrinomonadaceae bacterium]|jgi:hypothetical protein|nr:hypothetical protein [Pyrinomonadaceae bacterium]